MARYSNEFKARAVARLLPPESAVIPRLSQEIGVSVATLEPWMSDARLEAVIATAAMDEAQRGAWCREQGASSFMVGHAQKVQLAVRRLSARGTPRSRDHESDPVRLMPRSA